MLSEKIKTARQQNGLTQMELAQKLGVSQATVCNWEAGKQTPDQEQINKLQSVLGGDLPSPGSAASSNLPEAPSAVSAWLAKARQRAGLTVSELLKKSSISIPTIYNIEAGKAQNPRQRTIKILEEALGQNLESEIQRELRESSQIEGLGAFADFDPHDIKDWPNEAGVYVFYDISWRPIYVGQAKSIATRIRTHQDKFWFKRPIVESASYIPIKHEDLRQQVETVLIKFLKSNAVLNKQQVDRD